jgi:hypothetical protein
MSNTHVNAVSSSGTNWIFKVTVLTESDLILSDLGGIRLKGHSTTDLGKKFDLEQIKKSRSLAENIWNGDIWAWDTLGNQIGGRNLCEVETNLLESGTCDSKDIAIVCLEGCATDVISDYVALGLYEGGIRNVFQRGGNKNGDPLEGLWFAYPNEAEGVDPFNPTTNYLKSLEWQSFEDSRGVAMAAAPARPRLVYMMDRKTEKVYILTEKNWDGFHEGKYCYIRETLKNVLCNDCEKTSAVFGTNVPDACETYLYNNFGVSSNISPYLVTGAQSLCGLTLSYQAASLKDKKAFNGKGMEVFSSYRLWIEANGLREFYIPLPGGDWQGRYLDLCNPSPLNVVEFFEGRSELWRELNKFYTNWKERKEKIYEELVYEGCVLGIYVDGKNDHAIFDDLGRLSNNFIVDSRITSDLHGAVEKELAKLPEGDRRKEELDNLFSTGNPFYDEFIKFLYLIQRRMLFNADKIAVYVDCNDNVKEFQAAAAQDSDWTEYVFCDSISNINLTLNFCDYCDIKPISEIDGRVWGRVTDENGIGISGAELYFPKWDWSVKTDKNGNYLFLDVLFGDAGELEIYAQGFEEDSYSGVIVSEEVPSVEINFSLIASLPAEPNIISGYIRDNGGKGIEKATVELNFNEFSVDIDTNSDGYYEYQIPSNNAQMINVYGYKDDEYKSKGASANYDGVNDVTCDITLEAVVNLTVGVVGGTSGTPIDSTVRLYRQVEVGFGNYTWSFVGSFDILGKFGQTSNNFWYLPSSANNLYRLEVDAITTGWEDASREVTITSTTREDFALLKEQFTVNLFAQGQGSITGDGTYDYATEVTITATPSDGWAFVNWTRVSDGSEFGNNQSISFAIEENLQLNANFEEISPA